MQNKEEQKQVVDEITKDVSKFKALEALGNSEGGKLLIAATLKNIDNSIATLVAKYKTASEIELKTACAVLESNFSVYNVLKGAKENKYTSLADLKKEQKELESL